MARIAVNPTTIAVRRILPPSERLWNGVVLVCGQQHILREADLHPMAFADRNRRRYLKKLVEYRGSRLRNAGGGPGRKCLRPAGRNRTPTLRNFARSRDHAQRNRHAEDLQIMVVHLVLQAPSAPDWF